MMAAEKRYWLLADGSLAVQSSAPLWSRATEITWEQYQEKMAEHIRKNEERQAQNREEQEARKRHKRTVEEHAQRFIVGFDGPTMLDIKTRAKHRGMSIQEYVEYATRAFLRREPLAE